MRRCGLVLTLATSVVLLASCTSEEPRKGGAEAVTVTGPSDCTLTLHFRGTSYPPLLGVSDMEDIRGLVDLDRPVGRAFIERCNGTVNKDVRLKVWAVNGVEPGVALGHLVPERGGNEGGGIYVSDAIDKSDWPTFNPTTNRLE